MYADFLKKRYLGGYFTVEATLVTGMAFYVVVFIIYIGLFQYNRVILEQNAYRTALRAAGCYRENNEEVLLVADTVREELLSDCCFAYEGESKVSVQSVVKVTAQGNMRFSGMPNAKITAKKESLCLHPAVFLRGIKQLKGVLR